MFHKSSKEHFADSIIRIIETDDQNLSNESLGRYVSILYRRFRLGADEYYSDGFLYTDVDNV